MSLKLVCSSPIQMDQLSLKLEPHTFSYRSTGKTLFEKYSFTAKSKCVPIYILQLFKDHEGRNQKPNACSVVVCRLHYIARFSLKIKLKKIFVLTQLGSSIFFLTPSHTLDLDKLLFNVLAIHLLSFEKIL